MKVGELLEDQQERSLIGMAIGGRIVTVDCLEKVWGGDFMANNAGLTSLEGAPKNIAGDFWCNGNHLTSLEHAPSTVDGDFMCNDNKIISLVGAPSTVGGDFWCYRNGLTSLDGAPSLVGGDFTCHNNLLTSLDELKSITVGEDFRCSKNMIHSLEGIHRKIKKMDGVFKATSNPIVSHVLGLLLIEGLTRATIDEERVTQILNSYIGKGRSALIPCQTQLLDEGFEEFAKL